MDIALKRQLEQLADFGNQNDAAVGKNGTRMLNITPDTGEFLSVLVRATGARRVLEIGTSNAYSTLWLADAARAIGGAVTTIERSADKVAMARENIVTAGLDGVITQVEGDAGAWLAQAPDASADLVFLDSARSLYLDWWPDLRRVLRAGGLLVVDNATSHAHEMADFVAAVKEDDAFGTSLVPVGKGEFLAVKA
ncbi:O-methyltransferase [Massilia brevitalea]|uniref:O-methyltransferase n=1 Tax=Massilia brevitalea TaxID=442526 RepID=UPI002739DFC1|nr:class I SAM-dependent methyltransferase [Massilia brevitalea]